MDGNYDVWFGGDQFEVTHAWQYVMCEEAKVFKYAAHGVQDQRVRWRTALDPFFEVGGLCQQLLYPAHSQWVDASWGEGGAERGLSFVALGRSGPMGIHGGLWGPMGAYWHLSGPMGTHGYLWEPMRAYGVVLAPMGAYGDLWGPMGTYGIVVGLGCNFLERSENKLDLLHRHACRRSICHTNMQALNLPHKHAHTELSATSALMQRHNLPHMRLHNLPHSVVLAVSATQARMQLHNLPHRHACINTMHAGTHCTI